MQYPSGKVYLVGAGPGDPGLITVKGLACVMKADVIIYDHLVNMRLLYQGRRTVKLIYVGKQGGRHTLPQDEINALIIKMAREGKTVVRLKGGDPFIFGRGGEEAEALADNGISFEVVPGVSAATAVPTYAGIPLTHREHNASVAFVTGHEDPAKPESKVHWDRIATGVGTLVFFMGMKNLPSIINNLIANGRDPETPVAVIQWGTRTDQRVVIGVLKDIILKVKEASIGPPAVIVVGDVVRLRDKLNWYESKPLFGRTIMTVGSRGQADALVESLTECGATTIDFPVVDFAPPAEQGQLDEKLAAVGKYDWIIFNSGAAAAFLLDRLWDLGRDVRILKNVNIAAAGRITSEVLRQYGLKADLLFDEFTVKGVSAAFSSFTLTGKKMLIPFAGSMEEDVTLKLSQRGAEVTTVTAYAEVRLDVDVVHIQRLLKEKKISAIVFTDPSAVHAFVELLDRTGSKSLISDDVISCMDPQTASAASKDGVHVHIISRDHTVPSLIEALVGYFSGNLIEPFNDKR